MSSPRRFEQFFSSPENDQILAQFRQFSLQAHMNDKLSIMFDALYAIDGLFADEVEVLLKQTKIMLDQAVTHIRVSDIKSIQQRINSLAINELLDLNGGIYEKYVELFLWNVVSENDIVALLSSLTGYLNQIVHKKLIQLGEHYGDKYLMILDHINKNRPVYLQESLSQFREKVASEARHSKTSASPYPSVNNALAVGGIFVTVAAVAGIFAVGRQPRSEVRSNNEVEMKKLGGPGQSRHQ
jgi:hypothetical protein